MPTRCDVAEVYVYVYWWVLFTLGMMLILRAVIGDWGLAYFGALFLAGIALVLTGFVRHWGLVTSRWFWERRPDA